MKKIYFNVHVSNYFNVDFNNTDKEATINASDVLNCSIVSWDIDTKKSLSSIGNNPITLKGEGSGWWNYEFNIESSTIKTEPSTSYNKFMKGGGMFLFI